MDKVFQLSTGVDNVGLNQVATHDLRKGPFYHSVEYIITVTKIALTAGFTSPTLAQVIGLVELSVNTQTRRSCLAVELDTIQTAYGAEFGVVATDNLLNDLFSTTPNYATYGVASGAGYDYVNTSGGTQVVNGLNVPNLNTLRITTFKFTVYFSEPWRSSYTAKRIFGLPTSWPGGQTIDTQIRLSLLASAGINTPVIRATEFIDFTKGPHAKSLPTGGPDTTSAAILPMINIWTVGKNYSGTTLAVTTWGNVSGKLQQVSIFGQAGDYVQKLKLLADNTIKRDFTKVENDGLNQMFDWNRPIPTLTAPYDNANVTHLALDVSDDPTDWLAFSSYNSVELDLQLSQAAAANKNLRLICFAYDTLILP